MKPLFLQHGSLFLPQGLCICWLPLEHSSRDVIQFPWGRPLLCGRVNIHCSRGSPPLAEVRTEAQRGAQTR